MEFSKSINESILKREVMGWKWLYDLSICKLSHLLREINDSRLSRYFICDTYISVFLSDFSSIESTMSIEERLVENIRNLLCDYNSNVQFSANRAKIIEGINLMEQASEWFQPKISKEHLTCFRLGYIHEKPGEEVCNELLLEPFVHSIYLFEVLLTFSSILNGVRMIHSPSISETGCDTILLDEYKAAFFNKNEFN